MIQNRSSRPEDGLLLRCRTRVQFRIPPPSTRIRNVFGPFFLPKIPVRSGVSTHGLSNANRPERPEFAVFGPFSHPEPSLVSVLLSSRRRLKRPKSSTCALRFTVTHARPSNIQPPPPRPPVKHRTAPRLPVAPPSPPATGCAETIAGSCIGAAARRKSPARWLVPAASAAAVH